MAASHRLRMEFNSVAFMMLFVPCTFALYALSRGTRVANWVLAFASLGNLRNRRRDLFDPASVHVPVRLRRRRLPRPLGGRPASNGGLCRERRCSAFPAVHLQIRRMADRRIQQRGRRDGPGRRGHAAHLAAAAGHLVLYVPHDQLHGRHLSAKVQADRHLRRLRDLRCLLPAADRRPDRARLGVAAAGRARVGLPFLRKNASAPLH